VRRLPTPVCHPAETGRDSGLWDSIGPEMFRLKDRNDRDMCLAMTHEEVIAWLAAREIRSYRDLPQIWYQIQTKERDEARPRSGVLRTREFVMKDSYTLDPDVEALEKSYAAHEGAYRKIFDRCGLRYHVVQSDTGMMGGLGADEGRGARARAWRSHPPRAEAHAGGRRRVPRGASGGDPAAPRRRRGIPGAARRPRPDLHRRDAARGELRGRRESRRLPRPRRA